MNVLLTPEALKQYAKLPVVEKMKIKKRLLLLENDPYVGKKLVGKMAELHSLRAWPYRIIYHINEKKRELYFVTIAHRQGVYR